MTGKFVKAITKYAAIAAMGSLVAACGAGDSDVEYQATRNADHVPGQPTEDAMRCIERTVKATLENETNFSNWSAIKKEIYSLGCCWAGGGITLNILPKNPAGATFGCAVAYFGCKAKMLTSGYGDPRTVEIKFNECKKHGSKPKPGKSNTSDNQTKPKDPTPTTWEKNRKGLCPCFKSGKCEGEPFTHTWHGHGCRQAKGRGWANLGVCYSTTDIGGRTCGKPGKIHRKLEGFKQRREAPSCNMRWIVEHGRDLANSKPECNGRCYAPCSAGYSVYAVDCTQCISNDLLW